MYFELNLSCHVKILEDIKAPISYYALLYQFFFKSRRNCGRKPEYLKKPCCAQK